MIFNLYMGINNKKDTNKEYRLINQNNMIKISL